MTKLEEIEMLKKRIKEIEGCFDETNVLTPFSTEEEMKSFEGWIGYFADGRNMLFTLVSERPDENGVNLYFDNSKKTVLLETEHGAPHPFIWKTESGWRKQSMFFYPIEKGENK